MLHTLFGICFTSLNKINPYMDVQLCALKNDIVLLLWLFPVPIHVVLHTVHVFYFGN